MNPSKIIFKKRLQESIDSSSSKWIKEFIDSINSINVSEIEKLIEDERIINDQTKWEFLAYVRDRFYHLKANGNTELTMQMGKCMKCDLGCPVHIFKGLAKTDWIAFNIKEENGFLKDITICNLTSGI